MSINLEKSIFLNALDIESVDERLQYVQEACQGNTELYANVCGLLNENEREDNFVDQPVSTAYFQALGVTDAGNTPTTPGTMIGPYKLLEQIGEGGFGLVFAAEQQHPVRRRVALKIIKPAFGAGEAVARFEAERQALAMMDHENIARVYDAGITDTNQPYFVMELVRGVPLNAFCDNHKLGPHQRLELFISICHAVQHAHQKGIIHRDLKPSNVLVTLQDGRAVPKVIDFGLVKAIGQELTDKTIYTRFAAIMGTPAYMSPEQAEMSNVDVDTRSDIYSLGVLLYELLTGSTPFVGDKLSRMGLDELRRIIREVEPPRPSSRFSTLGHDEATTISAKRRLEPTQLTSMMRGDLDWVVMKALDKDRQRRYESASELALDVSRFLEQQPVAARPPTTLYRFSKFARRNKVGLTAATLVAAALVAGAGVSLWQARVAYQALSQARLAEKDAKDSRDELQSFTDRLRSANALLIRGHAYADASDWSNAHEAYMQAIDAQPRFFRVWMERGTFYAKLGLWDRAATDYLHALDLGATPSGVEFIGVPQVLQVTGNTQAYEEVVASLLKTSSDHLSIVIRGQLVGELTPELAETIAAQAETLLDDKSVSATGLPTPNSRAPQGLKLYIAGLAHLRAGHYEQAIERLEQSLDIEQVWAGQGIGYPPLAIAYERLGKDDEAREACAHSEMLVDEWLERSIENLQGTPPIPWFDWLEFLENYREAFTLVNGREPHIDSRLEEQRIQALSAIR